MRFDDLNEDGRIVKGVNTTADVGTGQTPIEAKKFGFDVNEDGYPPELHSKAKKNSKPNTLYNLGLAEQFINDTLQVDKPEKKLYTIEEWACIQGGHEIPENISKTGSKQRRKEKKKDCYMGDPDWPALIDDVEENISHTGTATAKSAKKKGLKPGDPEWFEHWFDLPYFMKEDARQYLNENPYALRALYWLADKGYKVGKTAYDIIRTAPPGSITPDNLAKIAIGGKVAWDKIKDQHKEPKKEPTTEEVDDVIARAEQFAQKAHANHKRKYTGLPYYTHLDEVRNIVKKAGGNINMQAAALLHDTIEDTATTEQDINDEFGPVIAKLVVELTDVSKPEDGNRATRKGIDRDKLAGVSADAQTIKYADLISNGIDIGKNDPKFAKVYHKEKADLLRVMTRGNKSLYQQAYDILPDELKEETMNLGGVVNKDLKELDNVFYKNGFELRIVGGAVRDLALGKAPKDIDLATDANPNEMERIFDKAGIRHKPTGIEHGTITAIMNGEPYEVTTLRADVATDGRHADVKFVRSWEEDAKRRDLTYNAMSMDFDGKLYDYHGGMDDLQDKVSRFVGDPAERIQEDYLRILRYFRFQGKLDSPKWSKQTIGAIKDNVNGLSNVSIERVWQEMSKLLSGKNIAEILKFMDKADVAKQINLPTNNASATIDNQDALVNLARLVDDSSIAKRWKMSNDEHDTLNFLVTHKNKSLDRETIKHWIADGIDRAMLSKLAMLQGKADMDHMIKTYNPGEFPITGNDLIAKGMKPGPELGKELSALRNKWKQSNFKATKDDLLGEDAKITVWTNPEYQGADVDTDYYDKQPAKLIDINKLTPFEPADKMDDPASATNLNKLAKVIQSGEKINPIVITKHEGKWLILDGHHRYFASIKAGVDKIRVVIADPKDLTFRDDVPVDEEGPFGVLARKAGHVFKKSQYKKAAEFLHKILTRKYKETDGHLRHTLGYYTSMIARQTGNQLNWRELEAEYLDTYGNAFFEDELTEDAVPYADIAAMATVAGVTWPIMKNMIKVAWKTGKGMYKITRLAQKAGVKLGKMAVGESANFPTISVDDLYHVGSMDASKKGDFSFEGNGLSVSTHPDAWKRIARGQVSGDTYTATKPGNAFLDAHNLTKNHEQDITQWAIQEGLLEQQETVTVSWYDDEMDDTLSITFNSMADAKAEYGNELEDYDVDVNKGGIVPTAKLQKTTGQSRIDATGVLDYILPLYAEQLDLDGVWWGDELDVHRYSAPRGVIVPNKIDTWKFAKEGVDRNEKSRFIPDEQHSRRAS